MYLFILFIYTGRRFYLSSVFFLTHLHIFAFVNNTAFIAFKHSLGALFFS